MPTFATVARVKDHKIVVKQEAPIERILGQQAQVLDREQLFTNNMVYAEHIKVNFTEESWPEEHARLNLFPIADDQFCLQLLYLKHTAQPETADIYWVEFQPEFFDQYPLDMLVAEQPFRFDQITEQQFNICKQSELLLGQLQYANSISAFTKALQQTETITHLLRRALETINVPFTACPVPACRFLAHESEREKVVEARNIIQDNLDNPLTIKELSRRVAMNECYLKKGFKALVGKTIHEYTQSLRIAKAKEMLQTGMTVSDVANELGYSSISHFSTAFKKATGTKPCELLQ